MHLPCAEGAVRRSVNLPGIMSLSLRRGGESTTYICLPRVHVVLVALKFHRGLAGGLGTAAPIFCPPEIFVVAPQPWESYAHGDDEYFVLL